MTKSIIPGILAGVTALWLAQPATGAAQTTAADVSTQTSETWNTIKAYTVDKKTEAVAYGRQLMKETDYKITQLEAMAARTSGAAKAGYEKQIQDLKVTRANASAKLDRMEKAGGNAWNSAKQGFADAYRDLQGAYRKVEGQFK